MDTRRQSFVNPVLPRPKPQVTIAPSQRGNTTNTGAQQPGPEKAFYQSLIGKHVELDFLTAGATMVGALLWFDRYAFGIETNGKLYSVLKHSVASISLA